MNLVSRSQFLSASLDAVAVKCEPTAKLDILSRFEFNAACSRSGGLGGLNGPLQLVQVPNSTPCAPRAVRWFGLAIALALLCVPLAAEAFCLKNDTREQLHAQSLDSGVFAIDLEPGEGACCRTRQCYGAQGATANILIVTGYVPVGRDNQPGWISECRVRAGTESRIQINGNVTQIHCEVQDP